MDLKACVCSLWPVHRSSSVGWRADYIQNLPLLFKRSVQECREWAGCTASGLVLKTRDFVTQKGVKDTQGQTIQFLLWSCGTQTWEGAQNNEKYADRDQDAHRAALAPPPLPFTKEKSLWNCLKTNSVCSLKKSPEKVTQLSLIGNTKWHDWSSQVTSVSKSTRSTNLNVKQENSGWQSWTYRLLGEHV